MPASTSSPCFRPARSRPRRSEAWTWDAFLTAAEKCHKAGFAFGLPLGATTDSVEWLSAFFRAHGAELVDAKGNITVKSDAGAAGDRLPQAAGGLPAAGRARMGQRLQQQVARLRQGRLDLQPAERVGGGQARCPAGRGEALDARHAQGAQGQVRVRPAALPGHVELLQEQVRGQEPDAVRHQPEAAREAGRTRARATTCRPTSSSTTSRPGTRWVRPRAPSRTTPTRATRSPIIPFAPAPPAIADQIYTQAIAPKMVVRMVKGEPMAQTLDWASREIEGFSRN